MKRVCRRFLRGARDLYESCGQLLTIAVGVLLLGLFASLVLQDWTYVATILVMFAILAVLAYVEAGPEPVEEAMELTASYDAAAAFHANYQHAAEQLRKLEDIRIEPLRFQAKLPPEWPGRNGHEL